MKEIKIVDLEGNEGVLNKVYRWGMNGYIETTMEGKTNEEIFDSIEEWQRALDSQHPFRDHRIDLEALAAELSIEIFV